ncbi:MAG: DUF2127 domain-containing protein [Candidatus Bathyarchaeota archaeon]|jgi:hypothetical protein|nr:DUF2127 domain-containing protein [Candidatus Bathyarchaeota archaeon]
MEERNFSTFGKLRLASARAREKPVSVLYLALSLIFLSGFDLNGGGGRILETTPIVVVVHGYVVLYALWFLTAGPVFLMISVLFYPPLHERVYQVFPHSNVAPILMGVLYLIIAYSLWKRQKPAWAFAVFSALSGLPVDFLGMIFFPPPFSIFGMFALALNLFIFYHLIQHEARESYGNPLKKLKSAIFRRPRQEST